MAKWAIGIEAWGSLNSKLIQQVSKENKAIIEQQL